MMGLRLRLVLLFFLSLLLRAEPFPAEMDRPGDNAPPAPLQENLSSYVGTKSAGDNDGRGTSTEGASLVTSTLLAREGALEETIPIGAEAELKELHHKGVKNSDKNKRSRKHRNRLLAYKDMYLPLAVVLMFIAGYVVFKLQRPPVPVPVPPEVPVKPPEVEVEKEEIPVMKPIEVPPKAPPVLHSRARLAVVKDLLPAAKRLASAVGTPEAQRLAKKVETMVAESEMEAAEVTESRKLQGFLDASLKALRALDLMGRDYIKKRFVPQDWMEKVREEMGDPISQETVDLMARLDHEGAERTLQPYEATYRSVRKTAKTLYQRYVLTYEDFLRRGNFEDESNGELLLSGALVIEALENALQYGNHLGDHAYAIAARTLQTFQALALADTEEAIAATEADLATFRVQAAAARRARDAHTPGGSASAEQQVSSSDGEAALKTLEHNISRMETTLGHLRVEAQSLQRAENMKQVKQALEKARQLQEHAESLLQECTKSVESLELPEELDEIERKILIAAAESAIATITAADKSAQDHRRFLVKATDELRLFVSSLTPHLKEITIDYLLENSKLVVQETEQTLKEAKGWREEAKTVKTLFDGTGGVSWASVNVRTAVRRRAAAHLCVLRFNLFQFLQEDVQKLVAASNMNDSHLSPSAKESYEKLKKGFTRAQKKAKNANDVAEAAHAVVSLRDALLTMQDAVFALPQAGTSRR